MEVKQLIKELIVNRKLLEKANKSNFYLVLRKNSNNVRIVS